METIKYPRTYHFSWSYPSKDDKIIIDHSLYNKKVIVTEKMDGENSTLYSNRYHARSMNSIDHPSRHWLKSFHASIKHQIPNNFRICGENLYAQHSIRYENLESYFLVFSVWYYNTCLSWNDTVLFCKRLGLSTVPVIEIMIYYEDDLIDIANNLPNTKEGYVVRLADTFKHSVFNKNVVKYVRKNHVQTDEHWMYQPVRRNGLKEKGYIKEGKIKKGGINKKPTTKRPPKPLGQK